MGIRVAGCVLAALLPASAASDPPAPTCGPGWRTGTSSLSELLADERGATLCAEVMFTSGAQMKRRASCVRLDFKTGAFTDEAAPTARAPVGKTVQALSVCDGAACIALDVPAKDAEALRGSEYGVSLRHDGARAVVPLPAENAVGEFDTATGTRLATHAVITKAQPCIGHAFFVGDAIYASARDCAGEESRAVLIAGKRRTRIAPLLFGAPSVTQLAGTTWAVASHAPFRVDVVDGGPGSVTWSVRMPSIEHDRKRTPDKRFPCCYALGLTAFGTLAASASPIARVSDSAFVAVTPRGVAKIDRVKKTTAVFRFPKC